MFDIGASELLVIVIVAVLVIGPKDLPLALRTAGRWIGKVRRVSAQFRTGFDAMVREAEMADMEKKWQDQNARIMAEHPGYAAVEDGPDAVHIAMNPLTAPSGCDGDAAGNKDAAPAEDPGQDAGAGTDAALPPAAGKAGAQ